jgi:3-oxoacyl-[acyl-carrier-protein] synthase-3
MSVEASKKLPNFNPDDVSVLIVATSTNRRYFPSVSVYVHQALGLGRNVTCFDISDACNGFIQALQVGYSIIKDTGKTCLVIGVDQMSAIVNWHDRSSCILFGDGAGAVLLKDNQKLFKTSNYTRSEYSHLFSLEPVFYMDGTQIFKIAIESITEDAQSILEENSLTALDLKYFIPHQANERINSQVEKNLGIEAVRNLRSYGNTTGATIPMALATVFDQLRDGDKVLMTGFGAGLRGGSVLLEI